MNLIFKILFILVISTKSALAISPQAMNSLRSIIELIEHSYVEDPNKEKILENAIDGIVSSLDPHSSYMNEEEFKDFNDNISGAFGGIGVEILFEKNAIKIISPIDGLAAAKAGIKAGDLIISVNDEYVSDLGYIGAVKKIRGDSGTKVHLTIMRENEGRLEFDLTREIVKIKAVKFSINDDIAYVRISTFNNDTIEQLKNAFIELSKGPVAGENIEPKGIILDMRNNPGGRLDQAVGVANMFLSDEVIVSTKGRIEEKNEIYRASKGSFKAPKVPLVILINEGTASAPEVVSGALQDHAKAIILGTKSFGKGSVQSVIPLTGITKGAIKLTIARYYTPKGRSIQAKGIEPDIIVEQAKVEYKHTVSEEKKYSEANLTNHLKNDVANPDKAPEVIKNSSSNDLYKNDYQYARAYDLIKGMITVKAYKK